MQTVTTVGPTEHISFSNLSDKQLLAAGLISEDPEDTLQKCYCCNHLAQKINELSDEYRLVLGLFFNADLELKFEEISEVLGKSVKEVISIFESALHQLKAILPKDLYPEIYYS